MFYPIDRNIVYEDILLYAVKDHPQSYEILKRFITRRYDTYNITRVYQLVLYKAHLALLANEQTIDLEELEFFHYDLMRIESEIGGFTEIYYGFKLTLIPSTESFKIHFIANNSNELLIGTEMLNVVKTPSLRQL